MHFIMLASSSIRPTAYMCVAHLPHPSLYTVTNEFLVFLLQHHAGHQHLYPLPPGLEVIIQLVSSVKSRLGPFIKMSSAILTSLMDDHMLHLC